MFVLEGVCGGSRREGEWEVPGLFGEQRVSGGEVRACESEARLLARSGPLRHLGALCSSNLEVECARV